LIKKNLLKICIMLICITPMLTPMKIAHNGGAANSSQPEIVTIKTTQMYSSGCLQNSSWPMFHHDVRHTGRSPFGMSGGWYNVKWKFRMDGMVISSPAIDKNGTLYVGSDGESCLFAIFSNGTEKWRAATGNAYSSPAIASDGIIYIGTNSGNLYAIYPNGTIKWSTHIGAGWAYTSPVINNNGTIYVASVDSNRLVAVNSNGTIMWYFYAQDSIYCSPAIGDDGTIHIGSNDGYMYAVYPNGTLKWKFYTGGEKGIGSAPAIADDGSIYFGGTSGYLYSLYPNGTLRWKIGTGYIGESSPAIGIDRTIYVGDQDHYRIYSVNPNGSVNWYYTTNGEILSSPAIDKNGIIYCGSTDGNLYALNHNGALRWKFNAGNLIESSPVIGKDGAIYIIAEILPPPDFHSYLYALEIIDNNPPIKPMITGQINGKIRQEYEYTIVTADPEGNNISYYINWGDGTNSGWIGPYPSGEEQTVSYTWNKKGTYTIQVKAKDNYSAESEWETLVVTMPYESPQFRFIEWLLEQFPNAFPILRYLFEKHNIR